MSNPLLELNSSAVHLLLSVAELGSISRAAVRHGLSQPSASRRVRDLEKRLGVSLLDRSTGGASFSSTGLRLVEELRGVVDAAETLLDAASQLGTVDQRPIKLVTTRSILRYDLPGVLHRSFGIERPKADGKGRSWLDLVLDIQPTLEACNAVRGGEADLGLVDGPHSPLGLSSRILYRVPLCVVVHLAHPWARRRKALSVGELTETPLLLPRRGGGTRDVIEEALSRSGVTGPVSLAGEMDIDQRLALAVLGPDPAIVRHQAAFGHGSNDLLCQVRTLLVLEQPIRLIWKGSEPSWLGEQVLTRSPHSCDP